MNENKIDDAFNASKVVKTSRNTSTDLMMSISLKKCSHHQLNFVDDVIVVTVGYFQRPIQPMALTSDVIK